MSIDKSLKSHKALERHRSVLTRAERIERLLAEERWSEEQGVLGLPKVRNLRVKRVHAKRGKPEAETTAEAAESATGGEAEGNV